jgi:hypothetical protein
MTEAEEKAYLRGYNVAMEGMMRFCSRNLGNSSPAQEESARAPNSKAEGDVRQTILMAVDKLNQSRHVFKSKQIQEVREMLEALL